MSQHPPMSLPCHDELSRLARDDPRAFETLWRAVIDSHIEHAPARSRQRLRGLQFRIDGIRRLSRSALGATVKIYQLMWDSFLQMNEKLQDAVNPAAGAPPGTARAAARSARVIAFQQRPCGDPAASGAPVSPVSAFEQAEQPEPNQVWR